MIQVVKQTKDEKMAMYMKLPKKQLAEMLINCNDLLDGMIKVAPYQQAEVIKCDTCGCTPSLIIRTQFGTFCQQHARYV